MLDALRREPRKETEEKSQPHSPEGYGVFVMAFLAAALGFVATALAPRGRIDQLRAHRARSEDRRPVRPTGVPPAAGEEREEAALE
jgi:hypothetical protein